MSIYSSILSKLLNFNIVDKNDIAVKNSSLVPISSLNSQYSSSVRFCTVWKRSHTPPKNIKLSSKAVYTSLCIGFKNSLIYA